MKFKEERIEVSHGLQGVSILEMPMRWSADGVYQDGKARIT
jgi:hypothetical protein